MALIDYRVEDGLGIIEINNPPANVYTLESLKLLDEAIVKARFDSSVYVIVLMGSGDKFFSAGADIRMLAEETIEFKNNFALFGHETLLRMENTPKLVIAGINGHCVGGGLEIAMACDFIYASENAKFGQPEINLGIIPGFGGTQRLPRLVGKAMAKELCLTGVMISAREAKEIGLVNKVFPPDKLWDETMKTAKNMASKGRVSLKAVKDCIERGCDVDLRDGCYMEADVFGLCTASPDAREGMTAFMEKRKPEFKGELT